MSDALDGGVEKKHSKGSRFKRIAGLSRSSSKKTSPTTSNFSASDILPQDGHKPNPSRPKEDLASTKEEGSQPVFGAPNGNHSSGDRSASPPSVFDDHEDHDMKSRKRQSEGNGSYDLKPPPPQVSAGNVEALATRFFSAEHLDLIIRDPNLGVRFRQFLEHFLPHHAETLSKYLQSKKAITAVEYANAVADQIPVHQGAQPYIAATLDDEFDERSRQTAEDLVEEVLPKYLTNRLVNFVTETLVKEIMGTNAPYVKDLVPSLAEVYCITDPSLPDNPIVYASEGMARQYGLLWHT